MMKGIKVRIAKAYIHIAEGISIPNGAIYARIDKQITPHLIMYVWCLDIEALKNKNSFYVYIFHNDDECIRKVKMNTLSLIGRSLSDFSKSLSEKDIHDAKFSVIHRKEQKHPQGAFHLKCNIKNVLIQQHNGGRFSPK